MKINFIDNLLWYSIYMTMLKPIFHVTTGKVFYSTSIELILKRIVIKWKWLINLTQMVFCQDRTT